MKRMIRSVVLSAVGAQVSFGVRAILSTSMGMSIAISRINWVALDSTISRQWDLMELIGSQPDRKYVYKLTQRGLELAKAYDASIQETRYYSALQQGDVVKLTYEDADDYGQAACLCSSALSHGKDRDLLREALFRVQDGQDIHPSHRARQLSLALVLDMVKQAENQPFSQVMRYGLYLGDFSRSGAYEPRPALRPTYERWRQVQARQLYTSALEILWMIFLERLQDASITDGLTFEDFMGWLESQYAPEIMNERLSDYLQRTVQESDTQADWRNPSTYIEQSKFSRDALTVFDVQIKKKWFTVQQAVEMLSDIFLRFYHLHRSGDEIWRELALSSQESHRLPMQPFFVSFEARLESGQTFRDLISWLYREYILSQHEYMAIRKLRYNAYDTFKFHYADGRFYRTNERFDQPLRHFALRLNNALNMLIDVGLVIEDDGICRLSADGDVYLNNVEALNSEH